MHNLAITQEEVLSLLHLPFFRAPNQLSPFYPLQAEGANGGDAVPEQGFVYLQQRGLWNPQEQELTLPARKLFVPVFSPTARVMLFRGAYAMTPFQEFYIFKRYVCQYFEQSEPGFRPLKEKDLVEHLRTIFSDRRTTVTDNQLSLFEPEFISLMLLVQLRDQGEQPDLNRLLQFHKEQLFGEGLDMPILGKILPDENDSSQSPDVIANAVESLLGEGFIEHSGNATLAPNPLIGELFERIHQTKGIYMIREEFDDQQILAREASIFPGERGYFVGRCSFHSQFQTRIVHIEDLEWHTLYRLINEIARHRDYLAELTLEVTRRFRAHVRG